MDHDELDFDNVDHLYMQPRWLPLFVLVAVLTLIGVIVLTVIA